MVPHEEQNALNGLHGYNGFLVGVGMGIFDTEIVLNDSPWQQLLLLLVPMLLTTVFCSLIHFSIRRTFASPAFTFAYNIALSCWLALAVSLGEDSLFFPMFVSSKIAPRNPARIEYPNVSFGWFVECVLGGVGQVFFAPEFVPSILVTCGLAIGSPISALLALGGSLVGTLLAVLTHGTQWQTELGLDGLSAVLAAIGLGGFYFVPSVWSMVFAILSSGCCFAARHVFSGLFVRPEGPAMTLPFCVVATIFFHAQLALTVPRPVPARLLESAEQHWLARRRAVQVVGKLLHNEPLADEEAKCMSVWPDLVAVHYKQPASSANTSFV